MNTYTPIGGMEIHDNDSGDYVAKPDYDALIQTLAQERQRREKAEAKVKELEGALALGQENCNAEYNRLKHEHNLAKLDWGGRLVEYRGRAEKAEAELKAYRDAVDAQPWATDEPIRVLLDRITERVQKAERELAEARKDSERLDWLEKIAIPFRWLSPESIDSLPDITLSWRSNDSLRKAIDAASEAEKGQP